MQLNFNQKVEYMIMKSVKVAAVGLLSMFFLSGKMLAAAPERSMAAYKVNVELECASPEAAERAELKLLPLPPGKNVAFSCRWDDNNPANIRMKKLMQKYGYKGTFYLLTPKDDFRKNVLPELHKDGFTVGNHTLHHYNLSQLTANGINYEMLANRIIYETLTGQTITAFIFPGGSFSEPFYPDVKLIISSCLRRCGMLGGTDNAMHHLNKIPGNEFFNNEGGIIYPGDRNTSTQKFDEHVARSLPSAGKTAHMTLGIHVWHSDKDFEQLEISMKKYAARPDWWYCNENEFLAYTYMFKHTRILEKKVIGKKAVFTLALPCPEYLGSDVPLWAEADGKNIEIKHTRRVPEKIAAAAKDGKIAGYPGLQAKLTYIAADRIRLDVVNKSNVPLEDVRLLLHLPPDFVEENLYCYAGNITDKYSKEWSITPNAAWKSTGTQLTALQMDFTGRNVVSRIWVEHKQEIENKVPPPAKIYFAARKFTDQEFEKASLPAAAVDDKVFIKASQRHNYRETMFKVPLRTMNKEALTALVEFEGGEKMTLQGTLPDVVYLNGKKLPVKRGTVTFDAPAGKCRIMFQHLNRKRALQFVQVCFKILDK